jgi:acyl-CoA synthetase (AMP-forming)/AMP-acid ligase II
MISATVSAADDLPLTVPALLRRQAGERASHPLLFCDDQTLTYAEADRRSAALARGLLAVGAGKGTHVGILHPNGAEFVVSWLAAARIGAVSFPLSTFSTDTELRSLLRGADIEVLLSATSYRSRDFVAALREAAGGLVLAEAPPLFDPALPALRRVAFDVPGSADRGGTGPGGGVPGTVDPGVTDHVGAGPDGPMPTGWSRTALIEAGSRVAGEILAAAEEAVTPADRMVVIYTSGSSSEPKGVIHCHGPLIRHMANLNEIRRYASGEVLFAPSPFFWIGGFAFVLLATLVAGATAVCSNEREPARVLDLLERTRPTMTNGFAAAVAPLAKDPTFPGRDLSSMRRGNLYPIMPPDARPADPELRHNMLGMTEAGSTVLLSDDESDQPESRRGSFGKPAPGFEARVVDPDTGKDCPPGELGELWLRGPFLMEGYYGRERGETFEPDGWYRTGDLFTTDSGGFHYFNGRRGEMIKTAGANVSPREVEAAVLELTGLTAHVVGVDDEARGQVVAAMIRVPAGQDGPDADELRERLRTRLSAYKVPRRIVLAADADVPMTSSGKVDLRALKARLRDA